MIITSMGEASVRLGQHIPVKNYWRRLVTRAAVTVILRNSATDGGIETLMIRRALREGDPWSGHMAFPGGRLQDEDPDVYAAAIRELEEEIGLPAPGYLSYLGRLSDTLTRRHDDQAMPMVVTPFVFKLEREPEQLYPNHEVAEIVWAPLPFLADYDNREIMYWHRNGEDVELPCYFYEDRRIWGLSLRMLDELIELFRR
ncbi:MAG: CoA pyrophosphatase [Pseudomonadota bacterium]